MKTKPFKGIIKNPWKQELPSEHVDQSQTAYGPNLGYYYRCRFVGHPQFGTTGKLDGAHTSLVVREYEENGKKYVETLNSIYEVHEDNFQ